MEPKHSGKFSFISFLISWVFSFLLFLLVRAGDSEGGIRTAKKNMNMFGAKRERTKKKTLCLDILGKIIWVSSAAPKK